MNPLRFTWITLVLVALAACASKRNLSQNYGRMGGFTDEMLQPGLYAIRAVGDLPFISAQATWEHRADQLCGKGRHQTVQSRSRLAPNDTVLHVQRRTVPALPIATEFVEGYVLCNASPLRPAEAARYVESLPELRRQELQSRLQADLQLLGGDDCNGQDGRVAPDTFYRRGKTLLALGRYEHAHACLMKSVASGPAAASYVDACAALGEIYERGLGVPADKEAARQWFLRAGLL